MTANGGAFLIMVISAQASRGSSAPINPYLTVILLAILFFAAIAFAGLVAHDRRASR